ncbi:EamA family transporter [candidate division KSB1 bacterium]|nr:EamA family transporter [candidate division KSB1 bacterium]
MVWIKLLFTALFWGGTFIAGRVISQQLDPYSAAFLRFALASFFLFSIIYSRKKRFPKLKKEVIIPVLLLGATGVLGYNVFFFSGLKYIHAGRASLIIATNPVFISIFASIFFGERLTAVKVSGVILSVIGAVIVISNGDVAGLLTDRIGIGDLFLVGCVACWVAYSLIGKVAMNHLTPFAAVSYSALFGALGLLVPAWKHGLFTRLTEIDPLIWGNIFYLSIFGTVLGFFWYYEGIQQLGPTKAGLFINFVPVSAIILGYLVLSEPVTLYLFIGAILVVSGVYLTNSKKRVIHRNDYRIKK